MYDLIEKLEALIEKWENEPYTGDYIKVTKSVCAKELREVIGSPSAKLVWRQDESSNDAQLQIGYFDDKLPF